jgi:hypothetical protein
VAAGAAAADGTAASGAAVVSGVHQVEHGAAAGVSASGSAGGFGGGGLSTRLVRAKCPGCSVGSAKRVWRASHRSADQSVNGSGVRPATLLSTVTVPERENLTKALSDIQQTHTTQFLVSQTHGRRKQKREMRTALQLANQ